MRDKKFGILNHKVEYLPVFLHQPVPFRISFPCFRTFRKCLFWHFSPSNVPGPVILLLQGVAYSSWHSDPRIQLFSHEMPRNTDWYMHNWWVILLGLWHLLHYFNRSKKLDHLIHIFVSNVLFMFLSIICWRKQANFVKSCVCWNQTAPCFHLFSFWRIPYIIGL